MSHESYGTVPKLLEYLLCLPWSCRDCLGLRLLQSARRASGRVGLNKPTQTDGLGLYIFMTQPAQ
jgi:hypothetical protein